jgi:predicted DNA-binding transcriptional regulator AlpA
VPQRLRLLRALGQERPEVEPITVSLEGSVTYAGVVRRLHFGASLVGKGVPVPGSAVTGSGTLSYCRVHLVPWRCTLSSIISGMELMTSSQVADLLGVSRQRVDQIVKTDPTFPQPAAVLPSGRIWERADIERWAREKGRINR